jgi:hypothetical protein
VHGVEAVFWKSRRRTRHKALIQQNAVHATRSIFNRSSSTAAAA